MKKEVIEVKLKKPRNPVVAFAVTKKAGAHRKSNKALRKAEKQKSLG